MLKIVNKKNYLPKRGKYENRNDLIFLLDEMLRYKSISQEDHEKAVDRLGIEMSDGEKRAISKILMTSSNQL